MLSRCFLDFSVSVWFFHTFVGVSQISSFFSYKIVYVNINYQVNQMASLRRQFTELKT